MCGSSKPKAQPAPPPIPPPPPANPSATEAKQSKKTLTTGDRSGVGKKSLRINLNLNAPTDSGVNVPA